MPLRFDEPFDIGTVALRYTVGVAFDEEVRIAAGSAILSRGERGLGPLPMPLLLELVARIGDGGGESR
jgi:hypothetical protein